MQCVVKAKDPFHSKVQALLLTVGEASLKTSSVDIHLKEKFSHSESERDLQIALIAVVLGREN